MAGSIGVRPHVANNVLFPTPMGRNIVVVCNIIYFYVLITSDDIPVLSLPVDSIHRLSVTVDNKMHNKAFSSAVSSAFFVGILRAMAEKSTTRARTSDFIHFGYLYFLSTVASVHFLFDIIVALRPVVATEIYDNKKDFWRSLWFCHFDGHNFVVNCSDGFVSVLQKRALV